MSDEQRPPRWLFLVLGGARSGKSRYAEDLAAQMAHGEPALYLATATAGDDDMRQRIAAHQAERPAHWHTIETPLAPAEALRSTRDSMPVVLLDCITLLVSNVLLADDVDADAIEESEAQSRIDRVIDDLLAAYDAGSASLILISNEVGMGIVPAYPLGRVYRDILGRVNARLAARADVVLLMVAGLPIDVKSLSTQWQARLPGFLAGE